MPVDGPPPKEKSMRRKASVDAMPTPSGSDAPKSIGGSDAAAQEVMPGVSSGEMMLVRKRQEEIEKTKSSDAGQQGSAWQVSPSARPVPLRGRRAAARLKVENPLSAVKSHPKKEQFFVPTLRIQVLRYWSSTSRYLKLFQHLAPKSRWTLAERR